MNKFKLYQCKMKKVLSLSLFFMLMVSISVFAAKKTWNGSTSSDWTVAANWNGGNVPAAGDKTTIPTGLTIYPIITSGTITIKDVKIDGTGSLTIMGGTFNATGKIEFLDATSPYGTVTQSGGTLNVKDLKFKGAGTFNQSGSSLLTVSHAYKNDGGGTFNSTGGTIQFTGVAGGKADFSTGTNQFSNIIIDSGADPGFNKNPTGQISVNRNYTNNNSSLGVTTTEFTFNGMSDQTISSASSTTADPILNTFGKLTIDNPGTVTLLTDVGAKISFTLTQGTLDLNTNILYINGELYSGPLPVELVSFSARISDTEIILNWLTATEVNNYGFEIQRSVKDDNWDVLGIVEGHGNSNSPKEYNFLDSDVNSAGTYSYRLKQIDNDGSYEFSKTIEVIFGSPINFELSQNYPNPFNPSTTISFDLPESGNVALKVFNSIGEEVVTITEGFIEAGVYSFNFNAEGLPSGMYIYQLSTTEKTQVRKMILMK
jgi:hypothetical protein